MHWLSGGGGGGIKSCPWVCPGGMVSYETDSYIYQVNKKETSIFL